MSLKTPVSIAWAVFAVIWLVAAFGAKHGSRGGWCRLPLLLVAIVVVLLRVFKVHTLAVHALGLQVVGAILLVAGLGFAVWARIYLGRNWGMPMTKKDEPELVTSGPYRFVRHPIYSGLLLALLGTALALDVFLLIAVGAMGIYFVYSARVEEQLMTTSFPAVYPSYRAKTKMLIPFLL